MDLQEPRRNIKLVIAYNGAGYHGWQRQAEGIITVQECVEDAATRVLRHRVIVHGAGRTDAGVNAEGQSANFRTTNFAIPLKGMRRAINSKLPNDIAVRSAREVPDDFHASLSAIGKTYRYRIGVSPVRPVMNVGQIFHYWRPLDIDAMRAAGKRVIGKHDFRGMTISAEQRENTVRTVTRCEIAEVGSEVHITVQGDGFLYNMVRIIAGTLIEIGRGYWPPSRIDRILATRDRGQAGPTAPPEGLTMVCVHYPPLDGDFAESKGKLHVQSNSKAPDLP
jgi:tRNA pseudouridine38-40 synthase